SLAGVMLLTLAAVAAQGQSGTGQDRLPAEANSAPDSLLEGQRVIEIRVLNESGRGVLENNPMDLPLQVGQRFTLEAVRESLRQLFRSGRYADLTAETTPVEGGLRLDFVARRNFYVNAVHVIGVQEPPTQDAAVSSMRLGLGEPFRESAMPAALERLQHTL